MTNRQILISINGGKGNEYLKVASGQVEKLEDKTGKKEAAKIVLELKDTRQIWIMNKIGDNITHLK